MIENINNKNESYTIEEVLIFCELAIMIAGIILSIVVYLKY